MFDLEADRVAAAWQAANGHLPYTLALSPDLG
jgi:hypothetical protein